MMLTISTWTPAVLLSASSSASSVVRRTALSTVTVLAIASPAIALVAVPSLKRQWGEAT